MDELTAFIALSRLKGIDRATKKALIETTGKIASLFDGKTKVLEGPLKASIKAFNEWKDVERTVDKMGKMGVDILTLRDREYPDLLKEIPDPPAVLYKKGSLNIGENTLAVIGSRKATFAGMNLAEKIANTVSSLGITVVSGLARGIDASAHKGALSERGSTIAVLGCGIDICYPAENSRLFERIGEDGLLLTEYGPGDPPLQYHFPERNRIIAGLSRGVLVVEASERSGSLITARLGLEYGREVMAVPGSIFGDEHRGANKLIKQGAKLVDGMEDILNASFPDIRLKKERSGTIEMDKDEESVYSFIGQEQIHIDEVIDKTGLPAKDVMSILTQLEMKEIIRGFPGGYYIRS
jgi:DNA processing protein